MLRTTEAGAATDVEAQAEAKTNMELRLELVAFPLFQCRGKGGAKHSPSLCSESDRLTCGRASRRTVNESAEIRKQRERQ